MGIIVGGLFVVIFCVFPVMFAAKKLGAGKSDLINCILATLVATFVSSIAISFFPGAATNDVLAYIYSFLVMGVVYKLMLQANYITSVLIALISSVITYTALYIVGSVVS